MTCHIQPIAGSLSISTLNYTFDPYIISKETTLYTSPIKMFNLFSEKYNLKLIDFII